MTSIANHLLSIYAGARGSANTWVNRPDRGALYGGRPPIEVMTAGSTQDLIRVPADLPPLPLSNLSEDARFLDTAALLLGAADSADAGGISGTARRNATPEASALVASFLFPGASRFSDGSFGLYYAAKDIHTAIAETVHHDVRRLRDMDESVSLDRQVLIAPIEGKVRSLVGREAEFPGVDSVADDHYVVSRALGRMLVERKAAGLVYRSVRRPAGRCVAVFDPGLVGPIIRGPRLRYHHDAATRRVVEIEEVRRVDLPVPPT